MRVAFFSPLPPARSGIADYSAALLTNLDGLAEIETFSQKPVTFDAARYDVCLYQLGNNPFHAFAYEVALEHPGVVVLHEANLHHLIANITITRGDWDAYLREVEIDGGSEALAYAKRYVRTVLRPPDYDLPFLTTVLSRAKAVIVHSDAVHEVVRERGFKGPIAKIPHGAWTMDHDRQPYRENLGISKDTVLFGIFGFLKPYKRIAESLRAFKRVIRAHPGAKLILVGEAHPDLSLSRLIGSLGLTEHVQHVDYAPIGDFNGYLAACDAIVNLRYPTVGETSGTLLRGFGMGKPVLVSDIGAFREYPDDICLKVPVNASEEEHIFEYMNLLASRREVGVALGNRAREWVKEECNWPSVAQRYAKFLCDVASGKLQELEHPAVPADYILSWTKEEDGSREYAQTHESRLAKTLEITPVGTAADRVLEMGAYLQITPALKTKLGYGEVRGCYFGKLGTIDHRKAESESGEVFYCDLEHFDAEKDKFPYEDSYFSTVLCCELIEHLPNDPMHTVSEINRILKPGGYLILTTPNVSSLRAVSAILQGFHPMFYPSYIKPRNEGLPDPRHAREYTAQEVEKLMENGGFEVTLLETGPFLDEPKPEFGWVDHLLEHYILPQELRGDGIYVVGKKKGPIRERYPGWLYN